MLWLAIHLPLLALEVLERGSPDAGPLAVYERAQGAQRICVCNGKARARGVRPGSTLTAAWAVIPQLTARPREPAAEQQALQRLAAWAGSLTSLVSLEPPASLLLEVGASLRLLGGAGALEARVRGELAALGYTPALAMAPTPLGALFLACAGKPAVVRERGALRQRLQSLPLACAGLQEAACEALAGMGVHHLGALLALPRAGLARRFGQGLLQRLDRALGRRPDPRRAYAPPPAYAGRLSLPLEIADAPALLFPLHRLLLELGGYLQGMDAGVERVRVELRHSRGQSTVLELGASAPTRDVERLRELARLRLERLPLPAAVTEIGLAAPAVLPLERGTRSLLPEAGQGGEGWERLQERLRARLGPQAVRGLALAPDPRPEKAWCSPEQAQTGGDWAGGAHRPLWLLSRPQPLALVGGRPRLEEALRLVQGPERIESGWWDGQEVARDYFVAETPSGRRLWVFRDRRDIRRWFLHGLFG